MHEVIIDSLAYGGDSVARLDDGRVAFVSGGCPQDRARVEIESDKGSFVRARLVEVLEESPARVSPPCPYFGRCGGCQWQHIAAGTQRAAKRQFVVDALTRIGGIAGADALVTETVAVGHAYGYRNKLEFDATRADGKLALGMHGRSSAEIVALGECLLLPRRVKKALKSLTGALRYLDPTGDLGIVRVGIRTALNAKDVEVALWTPPSGFPRAHAARIIGNAVNATSLVRVLFRGELKERQVARVEVLAGRGVWNESLGEFNYALSAPSFFQTNTAGAERLVDLVIDALDPDGTDRVLDLYAGAGTFTLPLAELSGEVAAVESYGPAVRDLRRNLESEGLDAEVIGGDAVREMATIGHCDAAVVDPPRTGIGEKGIAALAKCTPERIAYVSCDPNTLARDAAGLARFGYELVEAAPVDLFPQTFHVETVALFRRAHE